MKKDLDYHPSVVIVYSDSGEVLLSGYGGNYPKNALSYRSTPNLLGGNPTNDDSPRQTLEREIEEEFEFEKNILNMAPKKDIEFIKDSILKNICPFLDFYFNGKQFEGGDPAYTAIFSAFSSKVDKEVISFS